MNDDRHRLRRILDKQLELCQHIPLDANRITHGQSVNPVNIRPTNNVMETTGLIMPDLDYDLSSNSMAEVPQYGRNSFHEALQGFENEQYQQSISISTQDQGNQWTYHDVYHEADSNSSSTGNPHALYASFQFQDQNQFPITYISPQDFSSHGSMKLDAQNLVPYDMTTSVSYEPSSLDILAKHERDLRATFESIQAEDLQLAAHQLLSLTIELAANLDKLKLYHDELDDSAPRSDWREARLQVWRNFNNCWLALLLKEKDILSAELNHGQRPRPPHTRIDRAMLERLGSKLTEICDDVERFGIVDYERGIWHEQIVDLLRPCYDLALALDGL